MSEHERYARSFGSVVEAYERNRPTYTESAVDWIASLLPLHDVLDLGAGMGKLTRQLAERGAHVVAVEPHPDMRARFARVLPEIEILDGRAEAIPLADGAVDVVTAGQAFHWFDRRAALVEMHRVTRPGGGFALLWNGWHEDPLLSAFEALLEANRPPVTCWDDADAAGLFGPVEERTFLESRRMTADQLVGWAESSSAFVTARSEEQERLRARMVELVSVPGAVVRISTLVAVADRV